MMTVRDRERPIVDAKYSRCCRCAIVQFGRMNAESSEEMICDAATLIAYISAASDASEYHLEVRSSDSRLDRLDVRERIIAAYNAVFHEAFGVLNACFLVQREQIL